MSLPISDGHSFTAYPYTPTPAPGYFFTALFSLSAITHLVLLILYRSSFLLPLFIGCLLEAGGNYGRAWSASDNGIKPWVLTSLTTLAAPLFVAGSMYMAFGRMIRVLAPDSHAGLRPGVVAKVYVVIDVLCLASQIGGAGMQATTSREVQEAGSKVILAGLVVHSLAFVAFLVVVAVFHRRVNGRPEGVVREGVVGWRKHVWALYAASMAILVRNIVRAVEYSQGRDGALLQSEAPVFALDAAPMAFVVVLYAFVHPGRLVRQARTYYQAAGGSKA
ncbi:RTA1-like protein 13 [Elsinoe fawcettii]|nr:RTA1-like protein 13 [Elsinoe fawcettii]